MQFFLAHLYSERLSGSTAMTPDEQALPTLPTVDVPEDARQPELALAGSR